MNLKSTKFLIFDCQTTGMHPNVGSLLEIAWGWTTAQGGSTLLANFLVELPEGESIPARVREITGLKAADLAGATRIESVRKMLLDSVSEFTRDQAHRPVALIHYAQFEIAWLQDLLQTKVLPFDVVCTHRVSNRVLPNVPSRNIRGLTGFFGLQLGDIKRAAQHLQATACIWQSMVPLLADLSIETVDELTAYLASKTSRPKTKNSKLVKAPAFDYRVERQKRLALPTKPGIYKMIAKGGEVLYVGKATCLKDRVNSYFRGKKGRDARKLELMAQVWDLEILECESAVEAALVESDEIKRLNPRYNVSLKETNRRLLYYDRSLERESLIATQDFAIGPFRRFNAVENLRLFADGRRAGLIRNVFYQPIEASILATGIDLFDEKYPTLRTRPMTTRDHLAFGLHQLRGAELYNSEPNDDESIEANSEISDEVGALDVLDKIEHLYQRAATTYLRAQKITELLWSDVCWIEKGEKKSLCIRGGQLRIAPDARPLPSEPAWTGLAVSDYDRMSVLLMEISKVEHEISPLS